MDKNVCHKQSSTFMCFAVFAFVILQSSCQENRRFQVFESNTKAGLLYIVDHEKNEITSTYFEPAMGNGILKSSLLDFKKKEKVDTTSRF